MSGRDLHMFNTNYSAEDVEKLTLRMKNGLGSSKYKPAEYERLQAIVDAKRLESNLIGQKVNFVHYQYHFFLEREQEAFRTATVEPVHQLRDDLCLRLGEVQHQPLTDHPSNWDQVIQQVPRLFDMKYSHPYRKSVMFTNVNRPLLLGSISESTTSLEKRYILYFKIFPTTSDTVVITEKAPKEILDSDCPYPELKSSLIEAFCSLSETYRSRLQSLQEKLNKTDRFCGWCADDHSQFQFILSQYTSDVTDNRALCMDMLQRLFPERTRQELVSHERLWDWQHFTQTQLSALTQQWQRDHEELLARALVTLEEAKHTHQEELELHRDRQHQQDICSQLRTKLQQWRAQQEEVAKLEAAIAVRRQEAEEARLRREREREEAVRQFYLKQKKRREETEQRDQERLAKLRSIMEKQARRDKDRVMFRAEMLQRRREEREAREVERQRDEEERQKRLEVKVVVDADPQRVMADTEAWRSRHVNMEDLDLQKPLYSINTYTDTQIVSDPRVRVEQALREAGLHQSQYAKEVLSVIKPPKSPRRDTKSILKF
uniref:Coiled-coil domain containing 148 n=1 Tax=Sphaeramia orbicularis TaxID=375764 RepID=A0A673CWH3_9TELE